MAACLPIFGMTEGMISFCREEDLAEAIATSVGRPPCRHDEYRIVDPTTDEESPVGESGELLVRGPSVLGGYYDASERNAEAVTIKAASSRSAAG